MERKQGIHLASPARIALAIVAAAAAWLVFDTLSAPTSASASTASASYRETGTGDSLLGGLPDSTAPVVDTLDGYVDTVAGTVRVAAPVADAVQVGEVLDGADATATQVMSAVPVVNDVAVPVVAAVVEPITQSVVDPLVDQVVSPTLDAVVTPVVQDVVAPVVTEVVAPVAAVATPVLTPVIDAVVVPVGDVLPPTSTPVVGTVPAPNGVSAGLEPTLGSPAAPGEAAQIVVAHGQTQSGSGTPSALPGWNTAPTSAAPATATATASVVAGSPVPTAPATPFGTPFSPTALPAPAGGSISGSGPGNGSPVATTTPSGLLAAPVVRFHSSSATGDELPLAPSFNPGSTPD
ncbi:hypothetical protein [Cryobacterium arcticum]|uniref:Uncharacterized protein n=1 Tax=Cryobacterium arcticum TaxID=670052 RepID=A0A1B1BFB2_9MICO|nr:hypothetical protein [Cryobacterium arcticum]ANP71186.1 hypothetical protein PA27867_0212 [Cryobacterium arcticum]